MVSVVTKKMIPGFPLPPLPWSSMLSSFVQERMSKIKPKTEEHKKRISDAVKSKWADPEFRKRTQEKMRAAAHSRIIAMGGVPRPPRERRERRPRSPEAAAAAEARKMNSMARNQANFISRQERLARTAEVRFVFRAEIRWGKGVRS